MFERIKSILGFLFFFVFSCYLIWRGGDSLFVGHVIDYAKFKEFVINKKIKKVYLANKKAWFFEYFRRGRGVTTKQWETFINDDEQSDLLNFLKPNYIQVITNPSFINTYWERFGGLLWILFGALIMGKLLLKPHFM